MMKSNGSSKLLGLDRDLPTRAKDIAALRQARDDRIQDPKTCLEFLAGFPAASTSELSARKGPAGLKPFEL
jgi:hypothetical protein